ncbi:MAG: hypothetical protein MUD12_16150 [Spirochaetes bacterium]|jgi:hypothetical protein|nr:hypothetical protein [Spirochaetota bacterium]
MKEIIKNKNLLYNRFVKLIEDNHDLITESFMNDLMKNPETTAYRNTDKDSIYSSSDRIYRELSLWISREYSKEKIKERYFKLGRERLESGIPLPQVIKALILQRRHLWLFVMNRLYDDGTAYTEALQINNRVTLYFDRALFFMAQGYMQGISREI